MGEVHRARDRSTGRVVALKRLPSELDETEREQLERRLVAEASRSAALDVPGVVAVYDHGRVGERFYWPPTTWSGGTWRASCRRARWLRSGRSGSSPGWPRCSTGCTAAGW